MRPCCASLARPPSPSRWSAQDSDGIDSDTTVSSEEDEQSSSSSEPVTAPSTPPKVARRKKAPPKRRPYNASREDVAYGYAHDNSGLRRPVVAKVGVVVPFVVSSLKKR